MLELVGSGSPVMNGRNPPSHMTDGGEGWDGHQRWSACRDLAHEQECIGHQCHLV